MGSMVGGSMFVGIDVAKTELVVAVHPSGARWTVTNDERGGYELLAVAACAAGQLAKIDRIDADILALFAEKVSPPSAYFHTFRQ